MITAVFGFKRTFFCLPLRADTQLSKDLSSYSVIQRLSMSLFSSQQEYPIFTAVSILSPVSTHTLIPASFMNEITSDTFSWSLSSIAVDPMSSKSHSNSAIIASKLLQTKSRAFKQLLYLAFHSRKLVIDILFQATNKVLSPSSAKISSYLLVYLRISFYSSLSFNKGAIAVSAPLIITVTQPNLSETMTVIRFLKESNSMTFNFSYTRMLPSGS